MKQFTALSVLLLTGSLSAGCGKCDPPETAIYWTFTDASNRSTTSCLAAGVSTIRLFVNDIPQYDVNGNQDLFCADYDRFGGAVISGQSANDVIQVEGWDAQGNLLYLARNNVSTNSCGLTTYNANLTAQAGSLTVNLKGFGQCPINGYVWYSLTDVTDPAHPTSYSIVDGLHQNATSVPCAAAVAFDVLPLGTYQLDWIQIVQPTSSAQVPYAAVYQNCTPQAFSHQGDEVLDVTLAAATTACQ